MKYWVIPMSIFIAAPAMAQSEIDIERAADLMCQINGVCGDEALAEVSKDPQVIGETGPIRAPRPLTGNPARRIEPQAQPESLARAPRERVRQAPAAAPVRRRAASSANLAAAEVTDAAKGSAPLMVTFAANSAALTPESQIEINSFARVLAVANQGRRFRIEGHTDATGGEDLNLNLSQQRAQAVVDALVMAGIPAENFEAAGKGESEPLDNFKPTDPLNRRVVAVALD